MKKNINKDFEVDLNSILSLLLVHENYKRHPYLCAAGKLTIGIGRNIDIRGLSYDEAILLCMNDIARIIERIQKNDRLRKIFIVSNDNRKAVMIDMCFNLGVKGFCGFKKMLSAWEKADYNRAADEMLNSLWARQVKSRALHLAALMRGTKQLKEFI